MRKVLLSFFVYMLFCAEASAQNYHYVGYDIDTGLNLIRNAYIDKKTKECVLISSSLLLTGGDKYNKAIFRTHFTKFDSTLNISIDKPFQLLNSSISLKGCIKLFDGHYLGYGLYYNSKTLRAETTGVEGCIVKFNTHGDTIFTKKFPSGIDYTEIYSLIQLKDSSIVFLSFLRGLFGNNNSALRIVKLDTAYNVVWDSLYYSSDNNINPRPLGYFDALVEGDNSSIIVGGNKYTGNSDTTERALIFKVDKNGMMVWERTYYPNEDDFTCITSIKNLRDGNYLAVGYYDSRWFLDPDIESYIILIKFNSQGEVIWKRFFYEHLLQLYMDIEEFRNGDILLAGQTDELRLGYEGKAALLCLDKNGKLKWDRQYHNPANMNYDEVDDADFIHVEITNDNRIIAIGNNATTDSNFPYNNGTDQDFIFLYADSLGCIDPSNCAVTLVEHVPVEPKYFYVYPNPSSTSIHFSTNLDFTSESKLSIYNALGQLVHQDNQITKDTSIELSTFSKGIYFVELQQENGERYTERLVVE